MRLDLITIYAVMAFAFLAIGTVQILSFATGRFGRWPAWWGGSNFLMGAGTLMLAQQRLVPDVTITIVSDMLTVIGYSMLFIGVRSFAKRPLITGSAIPCALGIAVIILLPEPQSFPMRIGLLSLLYACWDAAIVVEGHRLNRDEGLRSAWLMVVVFVPTSLLFLARAIFALTGHLGTGGISAATNGTHALLAVSAAAFVMIRNMSLLMLTAERGQNELLLLAHTDVLTGALNRAGLIERSRPLASQVTNVAVLAIDIDHFKQLNDGHGHAAGDDMLRKVRLSAIDAMRDGDLLGRWGGDEFVLLLPDTDAHAAMAVARDVQACFANVLGGSTVTLSIGCATGELYQADFLPTLKRADEALYASKRLGRNRITLADNFNPDASGTHAFLAA
jgi:diguanylate cyclase (GGDEF)-like protein